jgi:hypothetical protein
LILLIKYLTITTMNTKLILGTVIGLLLIGASAKANPYGYGDGYAAAAYGNSYVGKAAYQSAQLNGVANIVGAAAPIVGALLGGGGVAGGCYSQPGGQAYAASGAGMNGSGGYGGGYYGGNCQQPYYTPYCAVPYGAPGMPSGGMIRY